MSAEQIADQLAIHDVLFRYARALDDRDWQLLRTCFTEDAVCEVGATLRGIDSIIAFSEGVLSGFGSWRIVHRFLPVTWTEGNPVGLPPGYGKRARY